MGIDCKLIGLASFYEKAVNVQDVANDYKGKSLLHGWG